MRIRGSMLTIGIIVLLLVGGAIFVQRQFARDVDPLRDAKVAVPTNPQSIAPQMLPKNPDGLEFERTVVPDTPFSATLITEANRRMPDGTVTTKTNTSLIYRDEKGRTRRDYLTEPQEAGERAVVRTSVINDPLTGFTYTLDHRANVAQQTGFVGVPPQSTSVTRAVAKQGPSKDQMLPMPSSSGTDNSLQAGSATASSAQSPESLGAREIEGVLAEGTRIRFTVPAKAEDEQAVEIVSERWYAPSIQAVILVKRTDPRAGETSYRLTDIKRVEPAADLFIVPGNYKIIPKN